MTALVALWTLGMAVLGEVVGATALVAGDLLLSLRSVLLLLLLRFWTVSGHVTQLLAVVALGHLWLLTLALDVANLLTVVALLLGSLLRQRTVLGLVVWLLAVVAQTSLLVTVFGLVARKTALVAGSREVCGRRHVGFERRVSLLKN